MNNKGFTLVEIISVIALLAILIIITVPIIGNVSENIKKNTLNTKIKNLEKAAVLYGQEKREKFETPDTLCSYCNGAIDCYCYGNKTSSETITVEKLLDAGKIEEDSVTDGGDKIITNSLDETKYLNKCEIQIYEKYGKIYAVYLVENVVTDHDTMCWYE